MTTWAIFYYDGNYNSSCIVEDPEEKISRSTNIAKDFPQLFVTVQDEEGKPSDAMINGVIEIYNPHEAAKLSPQMSLDEDCSTMFVLEPKLLS